MVVIVAVKIKQDFFQKVPASHITNLIMYIFLQYHIQGHVQKIFYNVQCNSTINRKCYQTASDLNLTLDGSIFKEMYHVSFFLCVKLSRHVLC